MPKPKLLISATSTSGPQNFVLHFEFIDIELHEAAKNRGSVRINFVTLGFAADIDLLSTTFGV